MQLKHNNLVSVQQPQSLKSSNKRSGVSQKYATQASMAAKSKKNTSIHNRKKKIKSQLHSPIQQRIMNTVADNSKFRNHDKKMLNFYSKDYQQNR